MALLSKVEIEKPPCSFMNKWSLNCGKFTCLSLRNDLHAIIITWILDKKSGTKQPVKKWHELKCMYTYKLSRKRHPFVDVMLRLIIQIELNPSHLSALYAIPSTGRLKSCYDSDLLLFLLEI